MASFTVWWNQLTASLQVFWAIGFCGLLLIALQGLMSLFAGHHEVNLGSHETSWDSYISLKSVSALLIGVGFGSAIFGENGFSMVVALAAGLVIGLGTAGFFLVLMSGLDRLRCDGTAMLWEAIGQRGKVYLRIPAKGTAPGEIQVSFAGRLVNVPAFTRGAELATGTDVLVISVHGENALEVEQVSKDQLTLT
jgi:hypothetical protein